MVNYSVIILLD